MSNRKHAMWNCRLSNMPEEGNMEINIFKVSIFYLFDTIQATQFKSSKIILYDTYVAKEHTSVMDVEGK